MKKTILIILGILLIAGAVGGIYLWQKNNIQKDWTTYKSDEFGFEIKYPDNYFLSVSKNGKDVIIASDKMLFRRGVEISIKDNLQNLSLEALAKKDNERFSEASFSPTTFLGFSAIKVVIDQSNTQSSEPAYSETIYFENKGEIIRIEKIDTGKTDYDQNHVIFDQIVSSFKLQDWQTYTSDKGFYEVKYPPNTTINPVYTGLPEGKDFSIDFTIGTRTIRISAWENKEGYTTMDNLINGEKEKQVNQTFTVLPNIYDTAEKTTINGLSAIQKIYYDNEGKKKIGKETIVLGNKGYYYEITDSNPFAPEFSSQEEKYYDDFVATFKITK